MPVDVLTEATIDRPIAEVASYAADPSNAPEWYANIISADWKTRPPLQRGSRIAFVARFLGRRFEYTYDAAGNWTERIASGRFDRHPEFQRTNIERRTITYYEK